MYRKLKMLNGIHPGVYLAHQLIKRNKTKTEFAETIGEHLQTLVSITKGNRRMNTKVALKIEQKLAIPEGFLMMLQVIHDIENIKKKEVQKAPDLTKFRRALFWDTEPTQIDWTRSYKKVIKRVYERGNSAEIAEINRYYGNETIQRVLKA